MAHAFIRHMRSKGKTTKFKQASNHHYPDKISRPISLERASQKVIQNYSDADLYIFYQPCTDDIGHELMGLCDPLSKAFHERDWEKNWQYIRDVYQAADRHLGTILALFQNQCTVVISSDHGMAGINHTIYVNEYLKKAGLLDFDWQGIMELIYQNGLSYTSIQIKYKGKTKTIDNIIGIFPIARHQFEARYCRAYPNKIQYQYPERY
jgi:predicted AlkP superfamily phosphohydrolase/phosphomutase